jgi:hypothetical protein
MKVEVSENGQKVGSQDLLSQCGLDRLGLA